MPCLIRRLTATGLVDVDYSADSLAEAVQHEPRDGVYTVASTMDTYRVVKLSAHLDRLTDSAQREGISYSLPHDVLRAGLRDLITLAGYGDVKFRVTVTRDTPNEPILSVEPFGGYPSTWYNDGVKVITVPNSARHNAAAKGTNWMHERKAIDSTMPEDVHTAILLDERGYLLEGTGSSFYAVLRDTLYTAIENVLPATSQQVVFGIAPDIMPLVRRPVHMDDVPNLQGAFISSSSRGIVPVIQIDEVVIGDGKPAPIVQQLRAAYEQWMHDHAESL